jgi:transcriptional regulator with XRE-family HTH domain
VSSSGKRFFLPAIYQYAGIMQAKLPASGLLSKSMARPALCPPAAYGSHLASLRKAAGLTQQQLAEAIGVKQSNIAFWERAAKPPRGEVLPALSTALGVSIPVLLMQEEQPASRHRGPASKVEKLMDEVSRLPRRRQQQILGMIEAMLEQAKAS